jgi:hypothetical protein
MMFVEFHHESKLMPFRACSARPGAKILSAFGGKADNRSAATDLRQRHSDLSKKINRIVRLMRTMSMYEPKLANEKDIDLSLPVARLAAIIGPVFAEL